MGTRRTEGGLSAPAVQAATPHTRTNEPTKGGWGRTPGTPLANVSDVPPRAFGRTPGNKGKRTAGPKKKPAKKPQDPSQQKSISREKQSPERCTDVSGTQHKTSGTQPERPKASSQNPPTVRLPPASRLDLDDNSALEDMEWPAALLRFIANEVDSGDFGETDKVVDKGNQRESNTQIGNKQSNTPQNGNGAPQNEPQNNPPVDDWGFAYALGNFTGFDKWLVEKPSPPDWARNLFKKS